MIKVIGMKKVFWILLLLMLSFATTTYAQKVIRVGGGATQNLQQVTDVGNVTTDSITIAGLKITTPYKFDNNDSALANGLEVGQVYQLPYDTLRKAFLLAIVDTLNTPPPLDPIILRILTNDGGASLPFTNSSEFESYFISYNPSLVVTSYVLDGDELIVRGSGFEYLHTNAFFGANYIVEVESSSLVTVGEFGFAICGGLTTVNLPSLVTVGEYGFFFCQVLTSVSLPSLVTIGYSGFAVCEGLTTVSFPSLVTVGEYGFDNTNITDVNLTNFPLVDYWGDNALSNTPIVNFETNASVIRPNVLENCADLQNVTLNSASALFDIFGIGGAYFNSTALPMTLTMPNLNNIINDPFNILIAIGIIDPYTDFTITIPSVMTGNSKILDAQAAGATIVGL